jgi:hypothetical protein
MKHLKKSQLIKENEKFIEHVLICYEVGKPAVQESGGAVTSSGRAPRTATEPTHEEQCFSNTNYCCA